MVCKPLSVREASVSEPSEKIEAPEDAPARGYLISAGIPAGLLLWFGSKFVLKRVGDSPVYQSEASETLGALEWLQGIGMAVAVACLMLLLWSLRKAFWRQK